MVGHYVNQVIFGQHSFYSNCDLQSNFSVAAIRQALEMRLRHGFGILGLYNKKNDSIEPLALSKIFEAISKYSCFIQLGVPLNHIQRVYSWTNLYVHSGFKDYLWKSIFTIRKIFPFIAGKFEKKGYNSIYNGIRYSEKTLSEIYKYLEKDLHSNYELVKTKPQAILIS